jgi:integrase
MAFLMLLRRLGRDDLTAHGFRSTFRDWAAERTNFPAEVAEMALAHAVSDKVEAAYRRGDLFQKRRHSRRLGRSSALPRRAPQRLFQSAKPLRTDRWSGRLALCTTIAT